MKFLLVVTPPSVYRRSSPITLRVLTPLRISHHETELQQYVCTQFPYFFSGIGSPEHLDIRPLPPASTTRPCAICLVALDLLPRYLSTHTALLYVHHLTPLLPSLCSPFPPSTSLTPLSIPMGDTFLVSSILFNFLEPLPSPSV